jgi:hypothetical protein
MFASFHILYQLTLILLFIAWCCINSATVTGLQNKQTFLKHNNNNNNYNKGYLVYVSDSWHTWRQIQAGEISCNCDCKPPQQLLMVEQWTSWMVNGNVSYVQAQWRERARWPFLGSKTCFVFLSVSIGKEDIWCLKAAVRMCQCVNLSYGPVF